MRKALPTEILVATGFSQGHREDGCDSRRTTKANELITQLSADSTWAEVVQAHAMVALAVEDQPALRTSLVALAGRVLAWISDIDQRERSVA